MLLRSSPPLHVTYCLNVHPGETWPDCFAAIREKALAVRERVASGRPFGLGLRLGGRAAHELAHRHHFVALQQFLRSHGLYAFTINGFPFGRFHGIRVKEDVYRPDWQDPRRLAYTRLLADLLAALVPEGVAGSISTSPLSFKGWLRAPAQMDTIVSHLVDVAAHLDALEAERGSNLHLGLEPEPACVLETTEETVRFFRDHLLGRGVDLLAARRGIPRAAAEQSIRRRIGVCFDTCHVALQFEDLCDAWDRYQAEGILISKVQLSAALACRLADHRRTASSVLDRFDDGVYLHQTHARDAQGRVTRWVDLPQARNPLATDHAWTEARVHCHVPLHWAGADGLGTTRDAMTDAFFGRLVAGGTEHLEIETYTFDVLPAELRGGDIVDSMSREFAWVLSRMPRNMS